jgi:hypothetical protein
LRATCCEVVGPALAARRLSDLLNRPLVPCRGEQSFRRLGSPESIRRRGTGQAVVILILIAILWLSVVTAVIGACRVAALGDAVELEIK